MVMLERLQEVADVFDAAVNGISVTSQDGTILIYNRAACQLRNIAAEDVIGRLSAEVFPDTWEDIKQILATGQAQIGRKITIGGRNVITNRSPIYADGQIIGVMNVFQDISTYEEIATDLKAYQRLNEDLKAIINSSYDGLWVSDHEGRVITINKASEKMNDVAADQVVGRKMQDIVRDGLIDRSVTLEVLRNRTVTTMIQELRNGKKVLVTGTPVFDDKGSIRLVVVNDRDITALNDLRTELEETRALSRQYLSEISQLKWNRDQLSQIVVHSKSMRRLLTKATLVAPVDSTVLLIGESGAGKGIISKFIHRASRRKDNPFVRVDCGSMPDSLVEAELFGYEKGAFTGARQMGKPGHFEMAEGGTLLLDEVGELPLAVQVKLLRFLEEGEVIRVGGTSPRRIDVRVIAATHRDLETMVRERSFRRDLFFRLNVIPLHIPPLRERVDDIDPLIYFFLQKTNKKCGTNKTISTEAVDCLRGYSWPGNVRELGNLIERLVVLGPKENIEQRHLPTHIRNGSQQLDARMSENDWNLSKAVGKLEKDTIARALKVFGSQRKAARALGLDQSTLSRKLRRYYPNSDALMHYGAILHG
jgi:PAS domain S-box-containing protein